MADTEPFGALPEPFYLPPPEETFDLPETFDTWLLSGLAGEQEKEGGCSKKRTRRGSGSSVDTGTETQCSGLSCDTTTSKKRCLAAVKEERAENDGESKQLDRKEKNRRSAAASRLRKKAAMEELQLKVRQLETENATLKYREAMANREIMFLRNELASLNTSADIIEDLDLDEDVQENEGAGCLCVEARMMHGARVGSRLRGPARGPAKRSGRPRGFDTSRAHLMPRHLGRTRAVSDGRLSTDSGEGTAWASEGEPRPLGPSPAGRSGGVTTAVNFAVVSENARAMRLCLAVATSSGRPEVIQEFPMHRTRNTFHVRLHDVPHPSRLVYGVRVEGSGGWETTHRWDSDRILLDPYAPLVYLGRKEFGVRDEAEGFEPETGSSFWGTFDFDDAALTDFDWGEGYRKPGTEWKDTVIYEMSVRLFTSDESSGLPAGSRGTFEGVRRKIPHLKDLGVTCVELLPIFEYDELEFQRSPNPRDHMVNVWGYSHINFFAPMSRFGSGGGGPAKAALEFKELVKDLHANGIEVVLDVVYNHTAEGGDTNPYLLSFRGIDCSTYYMQDPESYERILNYSGCGNTVNANNPVVSDLILDSLRHWVEEYHVDGFRFDLASALCRNPRGKPLQNPPLIGAISKDPVLSKVKLISEPWDCGGLYQVGSFPNWDVWAEWNGKYRDDVRRFIKGDPGMKTAFATRLAGSADLYNYNNRKPFHSVNFVIAHDGFTMNDLVSYNSKHNEDNGEESRDGSNDNFSWNCGAEGDTSSDQINQLRVRQRKNFHMALMVSQGTPMVLMGDEYGRSTLGNNNTYGLDRRMNYFRWDQLEGEEASRNFLRFYAGLIHYRRSSPLLGRSEFLRSRDITWHESNWGNEESCFLSFTLHGGHLGARSIYVAFNAHGYWVENALPKPASGKRWHRVVDTNLASPKDFDAEGVRAIEGSVYRVAPYSCLLLEEK